MANLKNKITELIKKRDEIAYQMVEAKGKYFSELEEQLNTIENEINQLVEPETAGDNG